MRQLALSPASGHVLDSASSAFTALRFAWTNGHIYRYQVSYESRVSIPGGVIAGDAERTRLNGEMHIQSYGQKNGNYLLGVSFRPDENAEPARLTRMFADREVTLEMGATGELYEVREETSHPPQYREAMRRLLLETQVAMGSGERWQTFSDTPHGRARDSYQRRGHMGDAIAIQRVRTHYEELKVDMPAVVDRSRVESRHRLLVATAGHLAEMHGDERIVGIDESGQATVEIESRLSIQLVEVIAPDAARTPQTRRTTVQRL